MVSKITYNKKLDSKKQWGSSGPRDAQRKQNLAYGSAVIQLPNMSVEELKQLLGNASPLNKDGNNKMTFEEVKKKIDEAVQFTIDQEKKRYESSIRNLNDQLNTTRKKLVVIEELLVEKNSEIKRLKEQIVSGPQNIDGELEKKNNEINSLKIKIEEKDKVIERLSNNYNENINTLSGKIDEIDNKLSRGIITSSEYKSDPDRPEIEDGVFIDPIEDGNLELDPHIKIDADEASSIGVTRDIKEDLSKLKHLLHKSTDDSIEEINTD